MNNLFNINVTDHPTRRNIAVFFYEKEEHSDYFRRLLEDNGIAFEFHADKEDGKLFFGIARSDLRLASRLNYLVMARFRKPFIADRYLRYGLITVTLTFIILAIIGYLKAG